MIADGDAAFAKATGKEIPYRIAPRRAGDLAEYFADPSYAKQALGWEATLGIDRMCEDTWRWQCHGQEHE